MGLGTNQRRSKDAIFVDLKLNAKGGEDAVGFRQQVGSSIDEAGKTKKEFLMHNSAYGAIVGFKAKEEEAHPDKGGNEWVGYLTLSDGTSEPNVCIRFPMEMYGGRRMVGLVNAAIVNKDPQVFLRTSFTPKGTVLGGRETDKDLAFLTLRAGDDRGDKREPVYCGEDGSLLVDAEGKPLPLPPTAYVMVGKKEIPDSSAADTVVLATALAIMQHFQAQRDARRQTEGRPGSDEGLELDPDEALRAAAPAQG